MIRVQNLTKKFGRFTAVDGVSFEIPAGQSVALWGSNGAGKTTIIRAVLGLYGFAGSITVGGLDIRTRGKHARRLIGYVPQELGFYDDLRVGEAIAFFARLKGLAVPPAGMVLARVGLPRQERKRVRELSGGMKQRLALAIALLGDPPVLVLDELTASLDALGRAEFVEALRALECDGRTVLFASHRPEEIRALADRVIVLKSGRIERECAPDALATQGPSAVRLVVQTSSTSLAVETLRRNGFDAHANGVGLIVEVEPNRKAAPIHLLSSAKITVDDFEFVDRTCTSDAEDRP